MVTIRQWLNLELQDAKTKDCSGIFHFSWSLWDSLCGFSTWASSGFFGIIILFNGCWELQEQIFKLVKQKLNHLLWSNLESHILILLYSVNQASHKIPPIFKGRGHRPNFSIEWEPKNLQTYFKMTQMCRKWRTICSYHLKITEFWSILNRPFFTNIFTPQIYIFLVF